MKSFKVTIRGVLIMPLLFSIMISSGCSVTAPEFEFVEQVYPEPPNEPRFYSEQTIRSSADVVGETDDQRIARMLAGLQRAGRGLGKPFGVATHQGRVFVSDPGLRSVIIFDRKAGLYKQIGDTRPGELLKPYDIEADNQGNIYVMDSTQKKALMYDRDGNFIREIGDPSMFDMASSLAVDRDGKRLYIVDTGGVQSTKHQVLVFDTATGEHLFSFGERGKGDMGFNLPKDATLGRDGLLYIVDSGNFRVKVHDPKDGSFVRAFGEIGRRSGQFARPKGIAQDLDGHIYVSDAAFGNFQIFTNEGQLLLAVGNRGHEDKAGSYMLPAGIAVDENGRVLMVDQFFKRVDIYRPAALKKEEGYLSKIDLPAKGP